MKSTYRFNLIVLLCLFMVSCSTATSKPEGCPATFDEYAYGGSAALDTTYLPANWEIIDKIPAEIESAWLGIALIRKANNQTEIWLRGPDSNVYFDSKSENYKYYIYIIEKKEWRTLSAVVNHTNAFAMRLLMSSDGTIWAQNFWDIQNSVGNPYQKYPILSRFDDSKQAFELVTETHGINAFGADLSWNKILYSNTDNIFWIIAQKDSIYSYDPASLKITKQIEIPNLGVQYIAASKDNKNIYLQIENGTSFSVAKGDYLQYVPSENKITTLDIPKNKWPSSGSIIVDHFGNLWLSAVGWRSPKGNWEMLYPNPTLFFWKMQVEDDYSYQLPHIILESADNRLWFSGEKGMAWLDSTSMQGCWFTNEYTNIGEDENNDMWVVIDHSLYKLTYKP